MFNLIMDWQENKNKTIEDIAKFHCQFEKIHLFQDGNGRIGRFIILKQCIEANIDLIALDNTLEADYKMALYEGQKTGDVSKLIDIFKQCQQQLDNKMKKYGEIINLVKKELEGDSC